MLLVIRRRSLLVLGAVALLAAGTLVLLPQAEDQAAFSPGAGGEVLIWDAGHGGADGGAVSPGGVSEKAINLSIARRGRMLSAFFGIDSLLTREDEGSLADPADSIRQQKVTDTQNRVALVNHVTNGILISIHQNSLPSSPVTHGAIVFYNTVEPADSLAQSVQEILNETCNPGNEKSARAISSDIYLMAHAQCPAILVECGFLSNGQEEKLLQDAAYQTKLAAAILWGYMENRG